MSPKFHPFSPASWPPHPSCCLPVGRSCRGGGEGGTEDQLPPAIVLWCLAEGATAAPCFAGPSGPSGWRGGGTSLMPPTPPVWPQAQGCDLLDAIIQPYIYITAGWLKKCQPPNALVCWVFSMLGEISRAYEFPNNPVFKCEWSHDSWPRALTSCRHFVAFLDTFYWSDTNTLDHFAFRRERARAKWGHSGALFSILISHYQTPVPVQSLVLGSNRQTEKETNTSHLHQRGEITFPPWG